MASEIVRVFLEDQQVPASSIENVLVRVYNAAGDAFIAQEYTNASGIATFTLEGDDPPIDYQIRMSKTNVVFDGSLGDASKSPQLIQVYTPASSSPTGTNDFTVVGKVFIRPIATDHRLCRASGFFRRSDGEPYPDLDVIFTPRFRPAIVDGDSVMWGSINTKTDQDGYLEVDLFRGGIYSVQVETLEDDPRDVVVPDAEYENLIELLFPVVEQVVFDPTSVSIAVDGSQDVVPTVTASDQRVLEGSAQGDVEYTVEDPTIASVCVREDNVVITGIKAGSTQLDVSRRDESIVVIPDTGITYTPLPITVS